MARSRTSWIGLLVILAKLGPKLLPVILKMQAVAFPAFKGLGGVKSAGVVLSAGMYTYLFTWQMAIALMLFIGIHEYGHIWAMHRCGVKTRGMFFIPGFGAVAIAEDKFGSARNEAYIALMGPIFGIVGFVLPMLLIYQATHQPIWAAVAGVMTLINLINLFPVNPLDGGRVMKALVYSRYAGRSLVIAVVVSVMTAALATWVGYGILSYLAAIGLYELVCEFGIYERLKKLTMTLGRIVLATAIFFIVQSLITNWSVGWGLWQWLGAVVLPFIIGIVSLDASSATQDSRWHVFAYPLVVAQDILAGVQELIRLRSWHITPIANYDWMEWGRKSGYTACFIGLVGLHVGLLVLLSYIPEASFAHQLLMD
ncbi:MAG: site-2 protease family protein [bacterium]|nr:site-2 protease family protein [bacterium]